MALLTDLERQQIADQIAEVERHTNAELVTVLCARSDDYRYIPLLWAALAALPIPTLGLFTALGSDTIALTQLAVFSALALLLRIPALSTRAVPRRVRHWRAANMARRQFLERGLHHTDGDTGILIFVSEAEHYVEILADRGIDQHVAPERWRALVDEFVAALRAGRTLLGFETTIARVGEILAEAVPKTPDNHNELDDRLILIGYEQSSSN